MASFNKFHALLFAFLILDAAIIFMVYQKYFKPETAPHQKFLMVQNTSLSEFLKSNPRNMSQPHVSRLETPFFSQNIILTNTTRDGMAFSGLISSENDKSDLSGKIEGFSKDKDSLQATLDLFSSKLERGNLIANRLSAKFEINETPTLSVIIGTIEIGRIRWGDIPLGNITATLRGTPETSTLKIKGYISGHQGTTFDATATLSKNIMTDLNGTLTISDASAFNQMLKSVMPDHSPTLKKSGTLLFKQTGHQLRFYYTGSKDPAFTLALSPTVQAH